MKLNKIILAAASTLILGACGENAWNDHLDGFQAPAAAEGTTNSSYTLTAADYSTIAGLADNKALAEADGESEALAAIAANGCFSTEEEARKYIPALLASTNKGLPYFTYNDNSNVKVSYNVSSALSELVKGVNADTPSYKVTQLDYIDSWGADDEYLNAFAPSCPASEFIPVILSDVYADTQSGQYVLVNYNESDRNPDFYNPAAMSALSIVSENALYQFTGDTWRNVTEAVVLGPADYAAMGNTYGSLNETQRNRDLPVFLKQTFPYAVEGQTETPVYAYYANSTTTVQAREYILTAGEWIPNLGELTSQFTKMDGSWVYNPSVVITLPYARNTDPSYTYYMECVKWVYENICVPMGDTSITSGEYFIDYRGNAEFYSGASAYYGNVDVRATSALNHQPAGYTAYEGLTNDEITLLMKKRFCTQVLPAALSVLHPDMKPAGDMTVTFTVNFTVYDGSASDATVVYEVVGPGEFRFLSTTCVDEDQYAGW